MDTQAEKHHGTAQWKGYGWVTVARAGFAIERALQNKDGMFWFLFNDPFAPATFIENGKNKAVQNEYGMIAGNVKALQPILLILGMEKKKYEPQKQTSKVIRLLKVFRE